MAVSLYCPNCGENLGKDTENPKIAGCGTCGNNNIKNPRGYDPDEEMYDWKKDPLGLKKD